MCQRRTRHGFKASNAHYIFSDIIMSQEMSEYMSEYMSEDAYISDLGKCTYISDMEHMSEGINM